MTRRFGKHAFVLCCAAAMLGAMACSGKPAATPVTATPAAVSARGTATTVAPTTVTPSATVAATVTPTASAPATATTAATAATAAPTSIPTAAPPPPPPTQTTVTVGLKEFSVTPDKAGAPAGAVTFHVQNNGVVAHDFRLVKSELAPDALPVANGAVDEGAIQVVTKSADIDAGTSVDVTATLGPGKYVLICNVPAHYIAGMRVAFAVTS
jgi:uncharacterized cupredoxin-like copper-binding protein